MLDLVQRYNRPGPRYTSYPTAPHFHEGFAEADYRASLAALETHQGGLSLYVHLPFCRKLCHYCGCHMLVTHRPERVERYLDELEREIDLVRRATATERPVVQMHWGGGTPTFLEPEQIERLASHLRRRFPFDDQAEVSIEADPRGLTPAHLEAARRAGFNRISFGVQDLDAEVQEAIGRVQPLETVERVTREARTLGFEGVAYDLIYGLPHQTVARFRRTVDEVIRLAPDRLSLFSYAHVPWMKRHQQLIETDWLPAPEEKLRILLDATERLTGPGGYHYIGMDHFARPDDPLCRAQRAGTLQRNFQGYSTHAGTAILGFGLSSIGQMPDAYVQNVKGLRAYYAALDAGRLPVHRGYRLTDDDRLRRHVIMQLMCHFELDVADVERRFGIDFGEFFAEPLAALEPMERDGLVHVSPYRLRITEAGRFLVRNIVMPFDRYLKPASERSTPTYSKTI